jgi:hypothetical protein
MEVPICPIPTIAIFTAIYAPDIIRKCVPRMFYPRKLYHRPSRAPDRHSTHPRWVYIDGRIARARDADPGSLKEEKRNHLTLLIYHVIVNIT